MFNIFHKVVRHIVYLLWMRLLQKKSCTLFPNVSIFNLCILVFFLFFPQILFCFPIFQVLLPPMLPFFNKIILFRSSHRRCSVKKVFLKGSQYLQENTSVWSLFLMKLQAYWIWLLMLQISNCCQSNYKIMENWCSPVTFSD